MASKLCIPKEKMPKATKTDWTQDKTIKKYVMKDIVVKTGEGENDYSIVRKQVLVSEQDRQEFINSFADDVGIMNILKKVAITGDATAFAATKDSGIDLINLPKDKMEAFDAVKKGVDAFDNLPDDLKKKMSMEVFVKTFGKDELDAYVASLKKDDGGVKNE